MKDKSKSESPLIGEFSEKQKFKVVELREGIMFFLEKDGLWADDLFVPTNDPNKALVFHEQIEAEKFLEFEQKAGRLHGYIVTEHEFVDSPVIGERSAEEPKQRELFRRIVEMFNKQHKLFSRPDYQLLEETFHVSLKAKEDSLPEASEQPKNTNMSDVEFYTKNLLACAHNLIGVIENKQWERLDKKLWALKDACTKLQIHSQVESKEDNKAFGEQDTESQDDIWEEVKMLFDTYSNAITELKTRFTITRRK